jgi:hypothetical protein
MSDLFYLTYTITAGVQTLIVLGILIYVIWEFYNPQSRYNLPVDRNERISTAAGLRAFEEKQHLLLEIEKDMRPTSMVEKTSFGRSKERGGLVMGSFKY